MSVTPQDMQNILESEQVDSFLTDGEYEIGVYSGEGTDKNVFAQSVEQQSGQSSDSNLPSATSSGPTGEPDNSKSGASKLESPEAQRKRMLAQQEAADQQRIEFTRRMNDQRENTARILALLERLHNDRMAMIQRFAQASTRTA